jgi:hypothetical protein
MSRIPIRARVLKRHGTPEHWLVILPTGRHVEYVPDHWGWSLAMAYANKAVREERCYEALKRWDEGRRIHGGTE